MRGMRRRCVDGSALVWLGMLLQFFETAEHGAADGGRLSIHTCHHAHFHRLQLQSRLRGGKGAGKNAPAADGIIRVPGDVGDLDEAIEMIPGAGSTLEFDCKQHVLDDCAIVRWGMHLNIVGAAQGGGTGARNAVWGNWTLLQRTRGSFAHLNLALHSYTSRMALLDIRGGPWALAHCDARCIGGLAVELLLRAKLIMTRCGVGGIDTHFMRAQDAVVCRMDSCADLEDCVLEMAGVISGYGIHLMEDARASLRNCSLLDNAIGCGVEGSSCLALCSCHLSDNYWAAMDCGATADKVTVAIDRCNFRARCGYVWLTNRRPHILRTRNVTVEHVEPDLPSLPLREGQMEDYNEHPKFHASRRRRVAERTRSYCVCQCPTCQHPNVKLATALRQGARQDLLGLRRAIAAAGGVGGDGGGGGGGEDEELIVTAAHALQLKQKAAAKDPGIHADYGDESSSSVYEYSTDTDGSSLWADLSSAAGDAEEYHKCVPSSVDLSISGARVRQRPLVSRPFEREAHPKEEAHARALFAQAEAEDWPEFSWRNAHRYKAMQREVLTGTLPHAALEALVPQPDITGDFPRLQGNLDTFTTQRYAQEWGHGVPEAVLAYDSDNSLDLPDEGEASASAVTYVEEYAEAYEALPSQSEDAAAAVQHARNRAVWAKRAERLGAGAPRAMTAEDAFKYVRIAAEGIKEDGNMSGMLARCFPQPCAVLDARNRRQAAAESAAAAAAAANSPQGAGNGTAAGGAGNAGRQTEEAEAHSRPKPFDSLLFPEEEEERSSANNTIFDISSSSEDEEEQFPASSDVALHDFLCKAGTI